jgi:hypothetical protein
MTDRINIIQSASRRVEGMRLIVNDLDCVQPDTLDLAGMFTDPVMASLSLTGTLPLNAGVCLNDL